MRTPLAELDSWQEPNERDEGASLSSEPPPECAPRFMGVRQAARYLQINEKKVYALASQGEIPATKVTGKWLFPRELLDQWLLESAHGGVLTDRLILAGSDDPLLHRVVGQIATRFEAHALVSYSCTGTQLGLSLLARGRADAAALHWGPVEESERRHPALLRQYARHPQWVLVRAFGREQGLMLSPRCGAEGEPMQELLRRPLRWILRSPGAGSQRYFEDVATRFGVRVSALEVCARAHSEREAASAIAMGQADAAPGARGAAHEFGLAFAATGWEAFDLALTRGAYFRTLFQCLLEELKSAETQRSAELLGGYDLREVGRLVWAA